MKLNPEVYLLAAELIEKEIYACYAIRSACDEIYEFDLKTSNFHRDAFTELFKDYDRFSWLGDCSLSDEERKLSNQERFEIKRNRREMALMLMAHIVVEEEQKVYNKTLLEKIKSFDYCFHKKPSFGYGKTEYDSVRYYYIYIGWLSMSIEY